ncbi:response regulator [Corynebacterium nasicanis]|uniref:Response regulator n=1 Tax=Corynebacterium nasicanis TaxID=1448267 RepID=A0ABW1QBV4_9CORY
MRVLLVDDEALVRAGLRLLLDGARGIRIVGEAADGREAADKARALRPDVILMDIRMPGTDGIRGIELIRAAGVHAGILMLTAFDTEADVLGAFRAGARGFLLKTAAPHVLVDAVLAAAEGHTQMSDAVLERLVTMASRSTPHRAVELGDLSEREGEIAGLIAEGMSNEEIGARLHLAVPTVKTYVSRIMAKTGAANRVQIAVAYLNRR